MIYIELVFNHFHPVQPQLAYTVYSVIAFICYENTSFFLRLVIVFMRAWFLRHLNVYLINLACLRYFTIIPH